MLEIFYSLKIRAAVLFEPLVAAFVIWKNAEHFVVELAGMVHVAAVAKLVDDNAVENFWRHNGKQTVKVQVAAF